MKNITLLLALFFATYSLSAQSYRTAAGLRVGNGFGVSVQQKILKNSTIEAILSPSFFSNDFSLDLLYEKHQGVISKRLNIYVGGGLHKAWRNTTSETLGNANTGFTGIIGAEISLKEINISVDYKPTISVFGNNGGDQFFDHGTAVSVRYILIKQKKKEINLKFWEKKNNKKRKKKKRSKKRKKEKRNWKFWEK